MHPVQAALKAPPRTEAAESNLREFPQYPAPDLQSDAAFEEELHQADEWYVPADVHAGEEHKKRGKREKKVRCALVFPLSTGSQNPPQPHCTPASA